MRTQTLKPDVVSLTALWSLRKPWVSLLGGSWVVISGVLSPLSQVISIVSRLLTLPTTTHEPSNIRPWGRQRRA